MLTYIGRNMKHAFLIIAHNNPRIFETLIGLLDFKDNDILFILIRKQILTILRKQNAAFQI